jgi:uncharacterized protein (DUF169 family)
VQDYQEISQTLQEGLRLPLPLIAVSFTDEVPAGVPMFEGRVPAGCSFWEKAAEAPFATVAADHDLCSIGVYTHNLGDTASERAQELGTVLKVLGELEYVRQEDIPQIPVLNLKPRYVVYAPLASAPVAPDVVLLFAHVWQSLIVTEATQQVELGIPPALGRPACGAIPQAVNTKRAAMSLGCCGARAYFEGLSDDIALWALPGSNLKQYANHISKLVAANQVLSKFHQLRRRDVEAGANPSYSESLTRLEEQA